MAARLLALKAIAWLLRATKKNIDCMFWRYDMPCIGLPPQSDGSPHHHPTAARLLSPWRLSRGSCAQPWVPPVRHALLPRVPLVRRVLPRRCAMRPSVASTTLAVIRAALPF